MSIKKQLIKNYLKIQLVGNQPGEMKIRIGMLPKLEEKYQSFESKIVELIKILPGITKVSTQFETGDITIEYDPSQLTDQQIIKWINTVVDIAIDYMKFISTYWETDLPYVIGELRKVLEQKAKLLLGK